MTVDSVVDGVRRAAEQRARRLPVAAAAGRLDPPAEAVVVDGAGKVEWLAALPHQDRPAPQGNLSLAILLATMAAGASGGGVVATTVS
jgi:hypothetical protein